MSHDPSEMIYLFIYYYLFYFFDQFNASLLNKCINFKILQKYCPQLLNGSVYFEIMDVFFFKAQQ